jgi:hypothetical protein
MPPPVRIVQALRELFGAGKLKEKEEGGKRFTTFDPGPSKSPLETVQEAVDAWKAKHPPDPSKALDPRIGQVKGQPNGEIVIDFWIHDNGMAFPCPLTLEPIREDLFKVMGD